ncbi:MAG: Hsp20/alpha crystallin family protein [Acidobacteriota bacterium]|nr:MAG: Hsp20/alpha crystallin family protein [Acidobacteriota bacterium]
MDDMLELRTRINRLFEDLMGRLEPGEMPTAGGEWVPRVDLYELPDRIVLLADVPGVRPEDLEVRIEGGHLVMRGSRRQPQDVDPTALCRMERPFGTFVRRYALPEGIDPEQVHASSREGVLEIVIGKREASAVRRIPIRPSS